MTIPCQNEQGANCRKACQKFPTVESKAEIGADDRQLSDKITSNFNYVGVRFFDVVRCVSERAVTRSVP